MAFDITFPRVIDSTMLAALGSCDWKFFAEYCCRKGPTTKSPDLHAGGAFAAGQEAARRAFWQYNKPRNEAVYDGVRAFIKYWDDYEAPEKHIKSFFNVAGAFIEYFNKFPLGQDGFTPYMSKNGTPALEFTFAVPLPILHPETNEPIFYGGRVDQLGQYNGLDCVEDDKTTKSIGQSWGEKWGMRGQFIGYCWAAQQYGYNVSAALVRGIAIQVSQYVLVEQPVIYTQQHIDRWYETMLRRIERAAEHYKQYLQHGNLDGSFNFIRSFGDACESFGGCWLSDICQSSDPKAWLDGNPTRLWDPLEKDPLHKTPPMFEGMEDVKLEL